MPRGDGTGPVGMGPMTGRAAGSCAGYQVPGYMNPVSGRGFGMGFGRGRGFGGRGGGRGRRNMYNATGLPGGMRFGYGAGGAVPPEYNPQPNPQAERSFLENQQEALQQELNAIKERLGEMAAEGKKKEE